MINIRKMLDVLDESGVCYIVVGGVAMGFHGSTYRTQDIDLVYERSAGNIERLVRALSRFNPRLRVAGEEHGLAFRFDARTIANGRNFTLTSDLGDVDILGEIVGIGDYHRAIEYADRLSLSGDDRETKVLSLDGLILAKRAANRPKDRAVLPELEALRELQRLERENEPNSQQPREADAPD